MQRISRYTVFLLMIAITTGVVYLSYRFLQKNRVSQVNTLKRQAKQDYYRHEYVKAMLVYKTLLDSMNIAEEPVQLNYAHAAYLSSAAMAARLSSRSAPEHARDSLVATLRTTSFSQYSKLSASPSNEIASIAANQMGYVTLQTGNLFADEKADSLLTQALTYFKNALIRDPDNDSARYNYELVKKIVLFPETILAQTRALVAEKKYREAADVLESAMQRDRRLQRQKEFLNRIKTIIGIDSLKVKKV